MDDVTHAVLAEVGLDEPWGLVEDFAGQPREKPDDANRGADLIVARLRRHGIPVTVHEPEIFLSLPFRAEVRIGDRVFPAKPPAFAASRPAREPQHARRLVRGDRAGARRDPDRRAAAARAGPGRGPGPGARLGRQSLRYQVRAICAGLGLAPPLDDDAFVRE